MDLRVKKTSADAILPSYSYEDDAGFDLYSTHKVVLEPMQKAQISTGISMQIPTGYVGLYWDKSGVSHKGGIKTMGGVIDSGYRGEIKVGVVNLSKETYVFEKGDKVAQMLIQTKETCNIVEVDELDSSHREDKGFGSSGK